MRVSKFYGSIASIGWKSRVLQLLIVSLLAVSMLAGCHHIKEPKRPPFPPLDVVPVEGIIEPSLATYLDSADGDELVPVMLIFKKHVSMDDKIRLFSEIETEDRRERKRRKRKHLVDELKRVARADQTRVTALLRGFEKIGQVREIRDLWISNIIGVRATKWVIPLLTHFEEIERIHLDLPRPVMGANTWGVDQVNAPAAWSPNPPVRPLGYDGTGVIVAVVDSGVDFTHPDLLSRKWINPNDGTGDTNGDGCPGVCNVDDDGDGLIDEDHEGDLPSFDVNGNPTNPSWDTAYVDDDDENGHIDDINGWNFKNNNNDLADGNGHGTHIAGIIAGDGTGDGIVATQTGVAPGAEIMAVKIGGVGNQTSQARALAGIQYVLDISEQHAVDSNPDNDDFIINFSSGWKGCYGVSSPYDPCDLTTCTTPNDLCQTPADPCNDTIPDCNRSCWSPDFASWRRTVQELLDAGILFVTISHNDRDPDNLSELPNNVRTPGRVPLALTVGATADDTNAIADFSNQGPVTWEDVACFNDYPYKPGLTKPDVVAPGVGIESTKVGDAYVTSVPYDPLNLPAPFVPIDGTSFAAPHVAGVAALLLDKYPGLSPYELKYLIEETAFNLGVYSPNNTFGWGLVNANDAINETISATPTYDLAITPTGATWTSADIYIDDDHNRIADTGSLSPGEEHNLYARVRNLGGQVVTNVELKFYYADVSTIGISGFDPDSDGDPDEGNFTYIDSYIVPTIGPVGSDHDTAVGLVKWTMPEPEPGSDHWCVGVGIVAPVGINVLEGKRDNNTAFRNFFDIITSTGGLTFQIAPPPKAPGKPFGFEIQAQNVPKGATIDLVVDKTLEKQLFVNVEGLSKVKNPVLSRKDKDKGHKRKRERHMTYVRYRMTGNRAVLRDIVSKKGASIPAKIIVNVPDDAPADGERLVILSTLDRKGKRVGGLTLNLVKGTPFQRGGPYVPKKVK